jgi:hypothetical protein
MINSKIYSFFTSTMICFMALPSNSFAQQNIDHKKAVLGLYMQIDARYYTCSLEVKRSGKSCLTCTHNENKRDTWHENTKWHLNKDTLIIDHFADNKFLGSDTYLIFNSCLIYAYPKAIDKNNCIFKKIKK